MATLATLRAHDPAGLDALPEHDAYFDVDDRDFDAPSRTPSLRIRQVRAWSARSDLDEPGMLDWIEWDRERSRITIHAVTGPEYVVDVDRLEVEVEITDHVDHHYRVRVGRLAGVESERRWR
jgi:adenylate cyclase class IV